MFSSSYSERKSKSGVRVVENDALRSQDETLMHTFKNKVSIRIGNEAVDGFLSFTSERVLFSREDDDKEETSWKAFQIYFKSVCVHAIESLVVHASPEEEKKEGKEGWGEVFVFASGGRVGSFNCTKRHRTKRRGRGRRLVRGTGDGSADFSIDVR